jgi:ribosomal protein S18 acetylase RimI-like enzyme
MSDFRSAQQDPWAPQPTGLPEFGVRPYRPATDEGYVVVSWTAEAARSPLFHSVPYDLAFGLIRPHVRGIISERPDLVSVIVPAHADEPICGFVMLDADLDIPVLWHLHVKGEFRGMGLMTDILAMHGVQRGARLICATDTRDLRSVMDRALYDITVRRDLLVGGR